MAIEIGAAYVSLVASAKGIGKSISQELTGPLEDEGRRAGDRSGKGFSSAFSAHLKAAAGAFAAIGVGSFLKGTVGAASDLNETMSKSDTIFGEASGSIRSWAQGAARGFGQSRQQALESAATFGNLFTQMGVGRDQAAVLSTGLTELASDFASFHNAAPADVIDAMTAAFRGEYDAVQRFVPTINAAAVEQKALAMTGKAATKELTAQERALAAQTLLFEGAGQAMGDFDRTSSSLANQQRTLGALWDDLRATLGARLLPAVSALAGFVTNNLMPAFSSIGSFIREHREPFIALAVVIGGALVAAFASWAVSAGAAAVATIAATAPVLAIGAAIAALVAGVIWAYQNWGWFRDTVDAVAEFLAGTLWPILQRVGEVIGVVVVNYVKVAMTVIEAWIGVWRWLIGIVTEVASWILSRIGDVVGFIVGLPGRVWGVMQTLFNPLRDAASAVKDWIRDRVDDVVGFLQRLPGRIGGFFGGMFDGIKDAFRGAINWVIRAWNGLQFTLPSVEVFGQKIGGFTLGTPDIAYLASGGLVFEATPAVVGEASSRRNPEVVAPLSDLRAMLADVPAGRGDINVSVESTADPLEIARAIAWNMRTGRV